MENPEIKSLTTAELVALPEGTLVRVSEIRRYRLNGEHSYLGCSRICEITMFKGEKVLMSVPEHAVYYSIRAHRSIHYALEGKE